MNVNLTPHLEEWIQQKIASGGYNNASEVIREALRQMDERDQDRAAKLAWLRQAMQEGIASGPPEPLEDVETLLQLARDYRAARLSQPHRGARHVTWCFTTLSRTASRSSASSIVAAT